MENINTISPIRIRYYIFNAENVLFLKTTGLGFTKELGFEKTPYWVRNDIYNQLEYLDNTYFKNSIYNLRFYLEYKSNYGEISERQLTNEKIPYVRSSSFTTNMEKSRYSISYSDRNQRTFVKLLGKLPYLALSSYKPSIESEENPHGYTEYEILGLAYSGETCQAFRLKVATKN